MRDREILCVLSCFFVFFVVVSYSQLIVLYSFFFF